MNKLLKRIYNSLEYHCYTIFGVVHYLAYKYHAGHSYTLKASTNVYFKILTDDYAEQLKSKNNLDISSKFIEEAISRGHICMLAIHDDDIIGYSWFAKSDVAIKDDIWISIPEKTNYIYKSFVASEFRGNNVLAQLICHYIKTEFNKDGLLFCFISANNESSIKAFKKIGFKFNGLIVLLKGGIKLYKYISPNLRKINVEFYKSSI